MAKASAVSLVNDLNKMYQQSVIQADGAITSEQWVFWMTRRYDVAWMLAKLTDDTAWWRQFDDDLNALRGKLSLNIAQ